MAPSSPPHGRHAVFISHPCRDHSLVYPLRDELRRLGWQITVDPFGPGDRTALQVEEAIKQSTHFILVTTAHAASSRWVRVESVFARHCYEARALVCVPLLVDGAAPLDDMEPLIHVNWRTEEGVPELVSRLAAGLARGPSPARRLVVDVSEGERLKERARESERRHWLDGDWQYNLDAIDTYEAALALNLSNHNAWANLAWCLWKQREDNRAMRCLRVAEDINPTSNHVRDVGERIRAGARRLFAEAT